MVALCVMACNGKQQNGKNESVKSKGGVRSTVKVDVPAFPYQSYLDGAKDEFPLIGDDQYGFSPISHKIRYFEVPDSLKDNRLVDSLALLYNASLAMCALQYDAGTVSRFINDNDFDHNEFANAFKNINLSGVKDKEMRATLLALGHAGAKEIRAGNSPQDRSYSSMDKFNSLFEKMLDSLFDNRNTEEEYHPEKIVSDLKTIHTFATDSNAVYKGVLIDTTKMKVEGYSLKDASFREELFIKTLLETDFEKKCIYAREFAYSNYGSRRGNAKELVAVIDPLLNSGEYSPLLTDLWIIWRTALQTSVFSGRSNYSAMYNLFYNDMRNKVATTFIAHIATNPDDLIAFNEFVRLLFITNIIRDSRCFFGNSANLDEMEMYSDCR